MSTIKKIGLNDIFKIFSKQNENEILELLKTNNLENIIKDGGNLLHFSVGNNNFIATKLLLENGFDSNAAACAFTILLGLTNITPDNNSFIGIDATAADNPDDKSDLLDPRNWKKERYPVLQTSAEHCVFGPGHNSFTTDENGNFVCVYHARTEEEITGNPLYNPNRHAMLMKVEWNDNKMPEFVIS